MVTQQPVRAINTPRAINTAQGTGLILYPGSTYNTGGGGRNDRGKEPKYSSIYIYLFIKKAIQHIMYQQKYLQCL